jgi:hypothetical protein
MRTPAVLASSLWSLRTVSFHTCWFHYLLLPFSRSRSPTSHLPTLHCSISVFYSLRRFALAQAYKALQTESRGSLMGCSLLSVRGSRKHAKFRGLCAGWLVAPPLCSVVTVGPCRCNDPEPRAHAAGWRPALPHVLRNSSDSKMRAERRAQSGGAGGDTATAGHLSVRAWVMSRPADRSP